MTGPFRRRRSAAPQKVLSENLSPISLSATEPSPSLSGGGAMGAMPGQKEGWSRGERMEQEQRRSPRGFPHVPGAPRLFLPRLAACFCFPGWAGPADGSGGGIWEGRSAPAESRLASRRSREGGREGGRTASAARGSFTGGRRSAGGRRRALLLRYYSVKTKHILRPSSAALARKCIFQSGWSQAFI